MSKRSLEVEDLGHSRKKAKLDTLAIRKDVFDLSIVSIPTFSITVANNPLETDLVESGDETEVIIPKQANENAFSLDHFKYSVGTFSNGENNYDGPLPLTADNVTSINFVNQYVRNRRNPFNDKVSIDMATLRGSETTNIAWINTLSVPEPYSSSWTVVDGHPHEVASILSLPASGNHAWRKYQKKVFTRTSNDGNYLSTKLVAQGDYSAVEVTSRATLPGWRHSVVSFKINKKVRGNENKSIKGTFTVAPVNHWDLSVSQPSLLKSIADFRGRIGFMEASGFFELHRRVHRARLMNIFTRTARSITKPSRQLSLIGADGLTSNQSTQKDADETNLQAGARSLAAQICSPEAWYALIASVGSARLNQAEEESNEIAEVTRLGRLERSRRAAIRSEKNNEGLDPANKKKELPKFNGNSNFSRVSELSAAQIQHMKRVYPPFDAHTEDVNQIYNVGVIFKHVVQNSTEDIDPLADSLVKLIKSNSLGGCSDDQYKTIADKLGFTVYAIQLCSSISQSLVPQLNKAASGSSIAASIETEIKEQARLVVVVNWMMKILGVLRRDTAFSKTGVFLAFVQQKCGVPPSVATWMFYNFLCLDQRTGQPTHPSEFLKKYAASFENGFTKAKWMLSIFAAGVALSPSKTVYISMLKPDFSCANSDQLNKACHPWLQMLGCSRSDGAGMPYTLKAPLTVPVAEGSAKNQLEKKLKKQG